jgi:hypothetical protein
MDVSKKEETLVCFRNHREAADARREAHDIPGTESLLKILKAEEMQKRQQFPQLFLTDMTQKDP